MRLSIMAAGLLAAATGTAATAAAPAASGSLQDDIRCIVLSNAFAKAAVDDKGKRIASTAIVFYLGRVDGHADKKALADGIAAARKGIDPKAAGPLMDACAARLAQAQRNVNEAIGTLAPAAVPGSGPAPAPATK